MQGAVKCRDCKGYGTVESSVWRFECNCSKCNGTGKIITDVKNICSSCNGRGELDRQSHWCPDRKCESCNGSGWNQDTK